MHPFVRGAVCVCKPAAADADETDHYLRTYAISLGRFDFDYARTYPEDVARLVEAFPGAWVNAHTSAGMGEDPDTGEETPYNTAGYALKQYGKDGRIQSIADSFAAYLGKTGEAPAPLHEPVSFLVLPFAPGALGMALARLLGFGALGCLYAGRLGNLLAYAALCRAALRSAQKYRPAFLAFMLLPLSLFMGASLSYDATLLGCYYLMLALLTRERWKPRTAAVYAGGLCFRQHCQTLPQPFVGAAAAGAAFGPRLAGQRPPLAVDGRHGGRGRLRRRCLSKPTAAWRATTTRSSPARAARRWTACSSFCLCCATPLRTIATFWGTLYENEFFLGQLGVFGWKDLPVPLLNLLGPCVLGAALCLCAAETPGLGRRRALGLGGFAAVYAAGAMAAMYITYTPVAMVRIVGLQARYFLPVFLALGLAAAAPLRRALAPSAGVFRAERLAVPLCAAHALLGAVLLFQHYFVGPFYTIPV